MVGGLDSDVAHKGLVLVIAEYDLLVLVIHKDPHGISIYNLNHATSGTGTLYTDADNTWGDYTLADVYECDRMARAFVRSHL